MRRLLWVFLLPVIWIPVLCLVLVAAPAVPLWAWVFGALFWVFLLRRFRRGADDAAPLEGGVSWSPTRRSGGLW